MAEVVYALCAVTSIACMILLYQGYYKSGEKLLMWSGICFAGLALNNVLLFVDVVVVPGADLGLLRSGIALLGMMALNFGLVWESKAL